MGGCGQRAGWRRGLGSRNEALSVIEPRLRELIASGTPCPLGKLARTINQVGTLKLEFVRAPDSSVIYVMVREGGKRLFTAYLDPDPPGQHLGGKVRIVTWQRGDWKTRLFDGPIPSQPS